MLGEMQMNEFSGRRLLNRVVNILLVACMASNLFAGAAFARSASVAPAGAAKTILSAAVSAKIFKHASRILNEVCEHLSKIQGWDVKVYSEFVDPQNRIFFAVKGKFGHKWPFREIERDRVLKVETDGNVAIDFFVNEASTENGFVTYEFNADFIIQLDGLVVSMAKFAAGVAASAAIDFAAGHLAAMLSNIDSRLIADALAKSCADFSKSSFNKSFEALADSLKEYEQKGAIYKNLINGIRNGNLLSFFVFNIINISAHQATNLAGAAIGSAIGTALFPGAGTIVGGLVAKASSLIITKFVIDKIGSEWFLKLELERFVDLARQIREAGCVGTSLNEKYEKRFRNIVSKLSDDIDSQKYVKFNTFVSFIESGDRAKVAWLRPVVAEINSIMQARILNDNDWVLSRKYLQLKTAVAGKGLSAEFGY